MSQKRLCDLDGTVIEPTVDEYFVVTNARNGATKDICIYCARSPEHEKLWTPSTAYEVGDRVARSDALGGTVWDVTVAGVSGTTEPTWTYVIGELITDGTVTYVTHRAPNGFAVVHLEMPGQPIANNSVWGWVNGFVEQT